MKNHPNRNKIKDWPKTIRAFREKHSLRQKDLAGLLQISLRNIENWESGISFPPAYLKKALMEIEKSL